MEDCVPDLMRSFRVSGHALWFSNAPASFQGYVNKLLAEKLDIFVITPIPRDLTESWLIYRTKRVLQSYTERSNKKLKPQEELTLLLACLDQEGFRVRVHDTYTLNDAGINQLFNLNEISTNL